MSGFTFRGVHSSKFGIYTQDQDRKLLPPRRESKMIIPGRSGYYDGVAGNVYDERVESISCSFIKPPDKTVPEVCREIAKWLAKPGRLVYDKEPDKAYTAKVSGSPPEAQHLQHGIFTITWSCNPPFALGKTRSQPITSGVNVIDYLGTAEAPCVIVLRNPSTTNAVNITITAVKRRD